MKKCFFLFLVFGIMVNAQNVGVNVETPHSSAILEVSSDSAPTSADTGKRGLLLPRVSLLNITDVATIPTPAAGLLVYNTTDNGVEPNNVEANNYYYWTGTKWMKIGFTSLVEEAVKPRVFYIEDTGTQTFTPSQINWTSGSAPTNVITFSQTPLINVSNIVTFNSANSTFTVNKSGLYDFSAFINYNPMNISTGNLRAFVNLKIQVSTNGGTTWTDKLGTRTAYGVGGSRYLKTSNIYSLPIRLTAGNMFRLVFVNPFNTGTGNDHGADGNPYIGTSSHLPISKGIRVQLLDFNL